MLSLKIRGQKFQKIRIIRGEESEGKNVRYNMRCNCVYENFLILSGENDFFEEFDYQAFRYMKIESDLPFEIDDIVLNVRHNKFSDAVVLDCDDHKLTEVWNLCRNTLKYSVQETFVDCPTREKGEYLGDFTVSGLAYMYITGNYNIYKRTLIDFADTQSVHKSLMAVGACSYMQEIADFSLMFPLQVWNYYKLSGDKQTALQLMSVIDRMLEYFSAFERADGLLQDMNDKWNLIDWPENLRDGYDAVTDGSIKKVCHNVLNAHYTGAHIIRDKIASSLWVKCSGKAKKLINSFNREFLDVRRNIYTDTSNTRHASLHSNALPLFYEFVPENALDSVVKYISGKRLSCGVFFSYFVLKGLANANRKDIVMDLIKSGDYWLNMIEEGATTTFEAWGKDQKWNTSLCHPWACSPIITIAEDFPDLLKDTCK